MTQNKKKEIVGIVLLLMAIVGMCFSFGYHLLCLLQQRAYGSMFGLYNCIGWAILSKLAITYFSLSKYDTDK